MAQLMLNCPPRFMLMKSKIITAIGATSLVLAMFALQGCYESSYPDYGYGYGYGSGPAYYSSPVIVRDYDEDHSWHHWWGHRDRDDNDSHEGWRHSEHEAHADRGRDHDRD